jgi:hypothetical protein
MDKKLYKVTISWSVCYIVGDEVEPLTKHEELILKASWPEEILKYLTKNNMVGWWKKMREDGDSSVIFINHERKEGGSRLQKGCLGRDAFWEVKIVSLDDIIEEVL